MSHNPKVSVLTPIYNVARYLPQCLDSLLAQSLEDIEFICINDGSTDESLDILKEYAQRDERIVIIDKPNGGYGQSMNIGLSRARGEYIGILESDDFAEPNMFGHLYELASQHELDLIRCNRFDHTDQGDTFIEVLRGLPYDEVFRPLDKQEIFWPAPCIWCSLYRKEFLDNNGIRFLETPGASFQDTGFVYKSLISAQRMMLIRDALLHYRVDNAGSSVKSSAKVFCICDEFASIDEYLAKRPSEEQEFRSVYQALRYQAYQWNYGRLGWKARKEFLPRFAAEFARMDQEGTLSKDRFGNAEWLRLTQLIDNWEAVYAAEAPLVSVIVPAYNCERHLIDTLASLEAQTLGQFEVIVIDDGSTDGTLSVAEDFAKSHDRVTVLHQENQGVSGARNTGLDAASGTYISFIDAGDTVPAEALEMMVRGLEARNAELAIGVIHEFSPILSHDFERTVDLSEKQSIDRYDSDLIWSFSVNNKLFIRTKIEELGLRFSKSKIAEDGLFLMQYVYECDGITGIPCIVLEYRREFFWDGFSATHTANKEFVTDLVENHEAIIRLAEQSIRADIEASESEIRRRELEVLELTYVAELHQRLLSYVIDLQYRRLWMLDDEAISYIREKINEHRAYISDETWASMCRYHADTRLSEGVQGQDDIAAAPEVSIALVIDGSFDTATVARFFESIYHNALPSFEVLVPASTMGLVPPLYRSMKNLRTLEYEGGLGQFMDTALAQARGQYLAFMHEPVFYNGSTLLEMWRTLHNLPADFVVAQIAQIAGDHQVLWTSQKTVFTFKRSEGYSKASAFNKLDLSMNNKLIKTRSLRSKDIHFSDALADNANLMYEQLSFKKLPDTLLITQMSEREFLGAQSKQIELGTKVAYALDRADLDHAQRFLSPYVDKARRFARRVDNKLAIRDTILFFSNRDELSDNLRLIYDGLDGKKLVMTKPLPHSAAYDRQVRQAIHRSKLIILDDVCQYLRDIQIDQRRTHVVQLWHACGAFKKFGLDNIHVPADYERRGHDQYSLVSVSSDAVRPIYARAFGIPLDRVQSLGVPRTDILLDAAEHDRIAQSLLSSHPELRDKKIVLYCPTFRQNNGVQSVWNPSIDWSSLSAQLSPDTLMIVKAHPLERFDIMGGRRFDNIVTLNDVSSSELLHVASLVITDYSSIVFDATLLNVPTIFYCPDLEQYQTGFYLRFPDDLCGELVTDSAALPQAIQTALDAYDWQGIERFKNKYLGACDGHSSERILAFIKEHYL